MTDPNNQPVNPQPQQMPPVQAQKKPIYKRVWFWIVVIIAVFIIYGISQQGNKSDNSSTSASTTQSQHEAKQPEAAKAPDVPVEYQSALKKADTYSNLMHMSKKGIYSQLTSEADKFKPEAAQYAVDNLKTDYNANALAKAKTYQTSMAMSPEAIRDQLTSEADQFTPEEAAYAIQHLNDK